MCYFRKHRHSCGCEKPIRVPCNQYDKRKDYCRRLGRAPSLQSDLKPNEDTEFDRIYDICGDSTCPYTPVVLDLKRRSESARPDAPSNLTILHLQGAKYALDECVKQAGLPTAASRSRCVRIRFTYTLCPAQCNRIKTVGPCNAPSACACAALNYGTRFRGEVFPASHKCPLHDEVQNLGPDAQEYRLSQRTSSTKRIKKQDTIAKRCSFEKLLFPNCMGESHNACKSIRLLRACTSSGGDPTNGPTCSCRRAKWFSNVEWETSFNPLCLEHEFFEQSALDETRACLDNERNGTRVHHNRDARTIIALQQQARPQAEKDLCIQKNRERGNEARKLHEENERNQQAEEASKLVGGMASGGAHAVPQEQGDGAKGRSKKSQGKSKQIAQAANPLLVTEPPEEARIRDEARQDEFIQARNEIEQAARRGRNPGAGSSGARGAGRETSADFEARRRAVISDTTAPARGSGERFQPAQQHKEGQASRHQISSTQSHEPEPIREKVHNTSGNRITAEELSQHPSTKYPGHWDGMYHDEADVLDTINHRAKLDKDWEISKKREKATLIRMGLGSPERSPAGGQPPGSSDRRIPDSSHSRPASSSQSSPTEQSPAKKQDRRSAPPKGGQSGGGDTRGRTSGRSTGDRSSSKATSSPSPAPQPGSSVGGRSSGQTPGKRGREKRSDSPATKKPGKDGKRK